MATNCYVCVSIPLQRSLEWECCHLLGPQSIVCHYIFLGGRLRNTGLLDTGKSAPWQKRTVHMHEWHSPGHHFQQRSLQGPVFFSIAFCLSGSCFLRWKWWALPLWAPFQSLRAPWSMCGWAKDVRRVSINFCQAGIGHKDLYTFLSCS